MSIPLRYRQAVVRTGIFGFGTYILYKMIMPSEEHFQKFQQDADEKKIGTGPSKLGRVVQLSQQGYSYEAITKIIAKEQKEKYKALYEQEAELRRQILEKQKLEAEAAKSLDGIVRSTADTITSNKPVPN